jgi:hypothetical protein
MANKLLDKLLGGEVVTYDDFMAATPDERRLYLTDNQYTRNGTAGGARAAAAALRNVTQGDGHGALSEDQYRNILMNSGLDPSFATATGGELGGIITRQEQDKGDWLTNNGWVIPLAMAGAGFASTLGGTGAGAAEAAGAAESASAGGSVAGGGGLTGGGSLGGGLSLGASSSGIGG